MGNSPSTHKNSNSASNSSPGSPSPASYESRPSSTRRDHPRNLTQAQRAGNTHSNSTTTSNDPSLARGTNAAHKTRSSPSTPVTHANSQSSSASQTLASPSPGLSESQIPQASTQQTKNNKIGTQDEPTKPVNVPIPASNNQDNSSFRAHSHSLEPSGPPSAPDMSYQYTTRPPRLPLPIEEEIHLPGSPMLPPADTDAADLDLDLLDTNGLPRLSSGLSNATIDEEEAEELNVDKTKARVPTIIEWKRGGDKVYVTGTIFQWNKKHRLHPVDGQPDLLRAVIHVSPGTHHIRFIVDTLMQCSPDLPTTVDFGNNLVNYIEVSADDLPRETSSDAEAAAAPSSQQDPAKAGDGSADAESAKPALKVKPALPWNRYSSQIPQYLIDLDRPEDSREYQYAAAAIEKLPSPPSLPGFLGKPILNAATPMKDDNSVLTMPNHTVLNHLATSSIKANVLAVSVTTRYKKKYVTTITYKPTGDD